MTVALEKGPGLDVKKVIQFKIPSIYLNICNCFINWKRPILTDGRGININGRPFCKYWALPINKERPLGPYICQWPFVPILHAHFGVTLLTPWWWLSTKLKIVHYQLSVFPFEPNLLLSNFFTHRFTVIYIMREMGMGGKFKIISLSQ